MGANVTRTDPKTGKDRVYYKADSGKLYNDYTSAATAFRENQIKNVMGVSTNIIDPSVEPSLVRAIAPKFSKDWGQSDYANPLSNTIGMNNYNPDTRDPYVEAHEAGHLSYEQATPAKFLGVSGRAVTGLSDQLNNPAPLELLGGALLHVDASEEDRAERLSAKYGPKLGGKAGQGPVISADGTSRYGGMLREQGKQRMAGAAAPLLNTLSSLKNSVVNLMQAPGRSNLEPQMREAVTNFRNLSQASDDVTPDLIKASNLVDDFKSQYQQQGGNFDNFLTTID